MPPAHVSGRVTDESQNSTQAGEQSIFLNEDACAFSCGSDLTIPGQVGTDSTLISQVCPPSAVSLGTDSTLRSNLCVGLDMGHIAEDDYHLATMRHRVIGGHLRNTEVIGITTTIKPEILRGVRLRKTLGGLGQAWRKRPVSDDGKMKLHSLSEKANQLKFFISHSWASNGWFKYASLLIRFYWPFGAVGALASAIVTFVFSARGDLPAMGSYDFTNMGNWGGICSFSMWCTVFGPMGGVICLLLGPSLAATIPDPLVFLDQVCIHQVDRELLHEGICSLGGFLKHTDEMIILWTRPYFTRLWCIFEVAAFKRLNEDKNIIFRPIFADLALFASFFSIWIAALLVGAACANKVSTTSISFVLLVSSFIPLVLGMPSLRKNMRDKSSLDDQIALFDYKHAQCYDSTDREFIDCCIRAWHGNAQNFNSYVRNDLRAYIRKIVKTDGLDYGFAVAVQVGSTCLLLDFMASLVLCGAPTFVVIKSAFFVLGSTTVLMPFWVYSTFMLAERYSTQRESWVAEVIVNVAAAFALSLLLAVGQGSWAALYRRNFVFSIGLILVWTCLTVWIFRYAQPRFRRTAEGEEESEFQHDAEAVDEKKTEDIVPPLR